LLFNTNNESVLTPISVSPLFDYSMIPFKGATYVANIYNHMFDYKSIPDGDDLENTDFIRMYRTEGSPSTKKIDYFPFIVVFQGAIDKPSYSFSTFINE